MEARGNLPSAESPPLMVGCFVPNSVITFTHLTERSPDICTLPDIESPALSYSSSSAVFNPFVFAMVKPPSLMVSCFP